MGGRRPVAKGMKSPWASRFQCWHANAAHFRIRLLYTGSWVERGPARSWFRAWRWSGVLAIARGVPRPLIISAPFGNSLRPAGTTATLGTFTARARPGRLWRILRTVRYYPRLRAWVNKIGLRNPGLGWLVERVASGRTTVTDHLVSVHGFEPDDWYALFDQIVTIAPHGVELNMSCPNVGGIDWPADLFERAVATDVPVIVKLPPVNYEQMYQQALAAGVRSFHCCNTLPVTAGGLSGQPLKPVALQCLRHLSQLTPSAVWPTLRLIGGGGIRTTADIDDYLAAGVHHVAIGTKLFNPIYLFSHRRLRPLIEHAGARLT